MHSSLEITPERLLLLLGLAFFFGLAFEEFYGELRTKPPGGVRTFPLLALSGAGLYLLEPTYAIPFAAGLLALGSWLLLYYWLKTHGEDGRQAKNAGVMVPVCNLLAFMLGPVVLWAPVWVGIGFAVAAVLLLGAREPLHALARRVPQGELATLGKFLILTGIVLPLLPNKPMTTLTSITPYQVWLAVTAISTISYASYLAQRYVAPKEGSLLASLLGGLYSSTATTVVLARRLRASPPDGSVVQAGIVLSTAVMYLRAVVVVAAFNLELARALLLPIVALAVLGCVLATLCYLRDARGTSAVVTAPTPGNPLELSTALLFAGLFVVVSLASSWAQGKFGQAGLYWLAAVLGVSDIDPFVLSVAQGAVPKATIPVMEAAILIAASSNNVLKAIYAVVFGGAKEGIVPATALAVLGAAGLGIVAWLLTASP